MSQLWEGIAKRLETRFGKGDAPILSRRLYRRLEVLCGKHGDQVYGLIAELAEAAAFADSPGKWFRAGIMRALVEEGIIRELRPRTPAGQRVVNHLVDAVARSADPLADVERKETAHAI